MPLLQLGSVPPAGERKVEGDVMAVNHKGTVRGHACERARTRNVLLGSALCVVVMALSACSQVYALSPKCPHLGLPMKTGQTVAGCLARTLGRLA